ncbi:hypothetical protein pv_356 [Pithovirus sibericum]|uniref:F-box domain-containing protein n=1 Tax=Pithovirus sibericum TaxID=1450746 RepID=W5S577_9VIRU|nr:hypothetical protein pv_356 [Pithovirus sibericum]AHH01923.1 hypothetical protein pv_356 [Pithovirus sibericum]
MQTLPNEIIQQILLHLEPSEILKANLYGAISNVCDWNFWKEKAIRDFEISKQYFDFPLQFPEGVGSFGEFISNSELNQGVYRYVQIANRFSLLTESFISEDSTQINKSPYEMIESHAFFEKAFSSNQFEHIEFLLENIPALTLTSYLSYEMGINRIVKGRRVPVPYTESRRTFESRIIESIFSPLVVQSFEISQLPYLPFLLQIEQGNFSHELESFINHPIDDYVVALKVYSVVRDLLLRDHPFDLSNAVKNVTQRSSEDGSELLLSAIRGGDRKIIAQILEDSTYSEYLNDHKDEVMKALSFNGDFDLLLFIDEMVKYSDEDKYIDAYSLASGYRRFRKPERYLRMLQQIGKIKNLPRNLNHLIRLADCDILTYLSHSPQVKEIYPKKVQFLSYVYSLVLGSLDCVAWVIRNLEMLNLSKKEKQSLLEEFQSQEKDPYFLPNSSVYRRRCNKSRNLLYRNYFELNTGD